MPVVCGVIAASILAGSRFQGLRLYIDKDGPDAVPQQGMRGRHEGMGRGDPFTGDPHRPQGRDERQGAIGEKADVLPPRCLASASSSDW